LHTIFRGPGFSRCGFHTGIWILYAIFILYGPYNMETSGPDIVQDIFQDIIKTSLEIMYFSISIILFFFLANLKTKRLQYFKEISKVK